MTTAQILFEQYKVLPPRVKRELKELIDEEDDTLPLREQIRRGLQEVKLLQDGKLQSTSADDFLAQLKTDKPDER